MFKLVKEKALERASIEGLDKDERIERLGDSFFNDVQGYALFKLSFYECFKCKLPYYGGMRDCGEDNEE